MSMASKRLTPRAITQNKNNPMNLREITTKVTNEAIFTLVCTKDYASNLYHLTSYKAEIKTPAGEVIAINFDEAQLARFNTTWKSTKQCEKAQHNITLDVVSENCGSWKALLDNSSSDWAKDTSRLEVK
tara:strand:- start:2613 stop:2999 length:387 start_codon:yes stop_codon:yes gene_type:complete